MTRRVMLFCTAVLLSAIAGQVQAGLVNWQVDSTQSFGRISVPDFPYDTGVIGTITIRARNFNVNNNNPWTDSGGRLAPFGGTIATNLVDGQSIEFLSAQSNLFAVETFNARPNPAAFDGSSYTNTSTAPAAFAANIRTSSFLAPQAGLLAIRNVGVNLSSGVIALGGGTVIAPNSTSLGVSSAQIGLDVVGLLAAALDDQLIDLISDDLFLNTLGGSVTSLGGLDRQLTLDVTVPLVFDLGGGVFVNGDVSGRIVAFATIPEPSSLLLVIFCGSCGLLRRRRA